ncbi:nitrilase-related carbon-nitrogen hydrolase [Vibrio quintilis]|uniref:Formamidase n=1 Tax=Vibrio quintilis TaxID=1117707 RepID=A0A1M7YQR3_9VIBR|nr:nitrilase-related carbon-nitrogen hydrolase [Vibrio quintilis]SHO54984.1 Formamidase [Vibrio quintilis]
MNLKKTLLSLGIAISPVLFTTPGYAQVQHPFLAAAVEFNPVFHERDKNISHLSQDIERALKKGAKLVVAPEMSTTGYLYSSRKEIAPYVDTIPGVTSDALGKLAKKYDAYIVIGMAEKDKQTGIYYNASVLVGPEGVVGKYRKTHQWEAEEHWAAWGDLGFPVFDTELGKIAINICMDSGYFESARIPAIEGADIIAFPTNSSIQAIYYNQSRAMQNGVYIVEANRNNTEKNFHMVGMSAIWDPDGNKLVEAPYVGKKDPSPKETRIVYAEIDPARYSVRTERLANRRTDLYQPLMLKVAPWDYTTNKTEKEIKSVSIQFEPVIGDKQANIKTVSAMLSKLKNEQLAVLPEYSFTGETAKMSQNAKSWAEEIHGSTFSQMSKLAKANKINLVYSLIEKDKHSKLYVTTVVLDTKGDILGSYRKTHLNADEKQWATAGDEIKTVDIPELGRLGLMSGEDVLYPEVAGILSGKRADMIAIPSSWAGHYGGYVQVNQKAIANPYPAHSMVLWDSVAFSAQAYTIVSNFVGTDNHYKGESALYTLDPLYGLDQAKVASSTQAQLFRASFKTKQNDWWLNQYNMVSSRRPFFYKPLLQQ